MAWPVRTHVCLDCRTLLPDAECPASGRHRVTSLAQADNRERLLDEVWGPKPLRQRLLEAGQVGAGTAVATTGFRACDVLGALELDWFFVIFLAAALLWFLGALIVRVVRKRRVHRSGRGARALGLQIGRMRGVAGTVRATATEPDPLTKQSCVAYAAELRDVRGVMLRDSATVGFELDLVTGETVRVPAGVVAIDLARAVEPGCDLDAYRRQIDPLRDATADLEAFPGTDIRLRSIRPGDTVEFLGEVEAVWTPPSGPNIGEAGYRDPAQTVLVPRGLVRLRPC
jgi:hypothetical protein